MHVYAKIRYSKNELRVQPSNFDMNMIDFFMSNVDFKDTLYMCCDYMWHIKQFFGTTVIIVTDTTYNPDEHYIIYDINGKGYGLVSELYSETKPTHNDNNQLNTVKDQCGIWLDDLCIPPRDHIKHGKIQTPNSFVEIILFAIQNFVSQFLGLSLNSN